MNALDKLFDLCKYNQFEKAIDDCRFMFSTDKERELAKGIYRIYRDNNVPIEVAQRIINDIAELNKKLDEKYNE